MSLSQISLAPSAPTIPFDAVRTRHRATAASIVAGAVVPTVPPRPSLLALLRVAVYLVARPARHAATRRGAVRIPRPDVALIVGLATGAVLAGIVSTSIYLAVSW